MQASLFCRACESLGHQCLIGTVWGITALASFWVMFLWSLLSQGTCFEDCWVGDNLPEKCLIWEKKRWWDLVKATVAMVSSLLLWVATKS